MVATNKNAGLGEVADAIRTLASNDPRIKAHEEYHVDLPQALVAVAGYGPNATWNALVESGVSEAGQAKGRSKASKFTASPSVPQAEEKYLRPNGDYYYPRKWGDHTDVEVLRKAREIQQFVLLYGAPGCGKTALTEGAFGETLYEIVASADTTFADFVGSWVAKPEGGYDWIDGPLIKAMREGKPLLIDEVGLVDPKELSGVYGTMDGRRELVVTSNPAVGTVKAEKGFYIVGATNPNAPGVRLSEALLSRFTIQVEMTTDFDLARKLGVPRAIVTFAQSATRNWEARTVSWAPQFRELLAYRDIAKAFGEKFAQQNLLALAPEMDRDFLTDALHRAIGNADVTRARI